MVDFLIRNQLELLTVQWGDEQMIVSPTYAQLAQLLDFVRGGIDINHCVDCRALLPGGIEGQLHFIRVNDLDSGEFLGWLVQISSITEFDAFLLADTSHKRRSSNVNSTHVELLGCIEAIDARCILTHVELLSWIREQLVPTCLSVRYRWVDIALALSE